MKVEIKEPAKREFVKAGDIMIYSDSYYPEDVVMIITNNTVNGCSGLVGVAFDGTMFSSNPNESLKSGKGKLYPAGEYKLVLTKI